MKSPASELIDYIRFNYNPQEKVKINKDGKQTIFFRKAGKPLCYIDTKDGKSTVTIVIGVTFNTKIESAKISRKAKEMFRKTKQFHDGKWLLFTIATDEDLDDIKKLLAIKRKPF